MFRHGPNFPSVTRSDPLGLWTFQGGLSGTVQWGPLVGNFSFGIAFDGHGNFVWYTSPLVGLGVGVEANAGVGFFASNADTVYGLRGPFTHAGGDLGLGANAQGEVFSGKDAVNGKTVSGVGAVFGAGGGGGVYGGVSYTKIYPLTSPEVFSPRVTGSYYSNPNGGSGVPDNDPDRVVVTATYPVQPGDPVNGIGFIRDASWDGYYTDTGSTTLAGSTDYDSTDSPTLSNFGNIMDYNPASGLSLDPGGNFEARRMRGGDLKVIPHG